MTGRKTRFHIGYLNVAKTRLVVQMRLTSAPTSVSAMCDAIAPAAVEGRIAAAITAFPDVIIKQEAFALGVSVLGKPFAMDLLTSAVVLSLIAKPDGIEEHETRVAR